MSYRVISIPTAFVAAALAGATAARAQTPPSALATVRGYIYDSLLTLKTLPNAAVILTGPANRSIVADARGRFTFDSLPAGSYTITFTHPSLDAIGYTPPRWSLELKPGASSRLFLATTSGADIYRSACPGPQESQTGAVLGSLREVNTRRPIAAGEVRVEWSESTISKELGISRRLKVARSATDSAGRFKICGVPNDAAVLLRARAGGFDGPPLELQLAGRPLAIRALSIDLQDTVTRVASDGTTAPRGSAVLRGKVREKDGKPVADAQVLVLGLPDGAQTTPTGAFELSELPGGTHTVEVRAIGFGRRREMIELRPDQPTEVDIRIERIATVLPELSVNGKAAANRSEFDQHREHGQGHYITEADIARRNPLRTEDIFRTVPGLTVVPSGGFDYTVLSSRGASFNGQCSPDFYIDGAKVFVDPQIGGGIPVNPGEIYGIEVYSGASTVPAEYQTPNGCGAVVIWTKRGGPQRAR